MRQEHPNGEVKENKVLLFTGLGLSAAAFLLAVVPFVVFLVPGGVSDGSPLVTSGIYINAFALAAALAGVIVTALSTSSSPRSPSSSAWRASCSASSSAPRSPSTPWADRYKSHKNRKSVAILPRFLIKAYEKDATTTPLDDDFLFPIIT